MIGLIGCGNRRVSRRGVIARLALALTMAALLPSMAYAGTTPPTIANNTFASTPVGQSLTQTVTLTLNSASVIKSIALATGTAASSEYVLESVSGCTVDGTTSNASGSVCKLSVKYTPSHPGSLASPSLSRNAQLLYTDGNSNVTAYGLSGAASQVVPQVVPGTISLYAGVPDTAPTISPLDNGLGPVVGGYAGIGVGATSAEFQFASYNAILTSITPSNGTQPMALDAQGNLYVIDGPNFVIRKIDNTSQHLVTTIAGTAGSQGYSGDGGLATSATLNAPRAITLDAAGNIYFLDNTKIQYYIFPASVIRRIDAVTGIITTVAGQNFNGTAYDTTDGGGTCTLSSSAYTVYECGDGGLATYAFLNQPYNLALDGAGNFYLWGAGLSEENVVVLRKINASTGIITTIGNETNLNATQTYGGMTVGADGNLYVNVIDSTANIGEVKQFNPTTMVATSLTGSKSASFSTANCQLPTTQQAGFAGADLFMATGPSPTSGDLSADASGNLYESNDLCTNGAIDLYNFPPAIVRINIASATAYPVVIADNASNVNNSTSGFNAFYNYGIQPVSAIPDNLGNIFFTTNNQIAVLSGMNAALNYPDQLDFTTSAAKTALYANVGNEAAAPPTYTFATGANFVLLETGDTNACDVVTSIAAGAGCNLDVAFAPVATGPLADTLNVSGNASTETVTLTGVGDAAAQLGVSPLSVDFGNQIENTTSAPKTFTLTDTGTANLTIENSLVDGLNTLNYAIVPNGGTCNTSSSTVLTPSNSCTVQVTFTPTSLGSLPAKFYVNTSVSFGDVATIAGTGVTAPAGVSETGNLWFNPAPVAIAPASAQTLTATFTITKLTSVITPTAMMHYGLAYKVGKVTCTGAAGNQTCTVPVTFIPNYPGGRRDALFLMNGTTRLATVLAYGVGESPFALIQPGVVTNLNMGNYVYDSVVDENGTVYSEINNSVTSTTAAGVSTALSVAGPDSNSDLSIDGAGVIYFGDPPANTSKIVTYDTVQDIVGSLPTPVTATYFDGVAAGNEGNLYIVDNDNSMLYTLKPDGTTTTLALTVTNPYSMVVDTNENLFVSNGGNHDTDEITPAGVQTSIDPTGGGLGIDAANTVYVERFYGLGTSGVGELPASSYASPEAVIDLGTSPTGNGSVAPDGTVYVGNYNNLDKVDRSQGTINFGEQSAGTAATPTAVQIYNGGNEKLTLSNISISGEAFTIATSSSDNCSTTTGIAVGALCNLTVAFLPTHAGVYSGTVTITSNSLNNTTTTQTVALSGFVYGVYVQAAPSPLPFGSVTVGDTSGPLTVTFTNNGDLYSAGIGGFTSTDPAFVVTVGPAGCFNVGVAASCTATVTFAPTAAKAYSATISYTASSSGGGPNQNGSFTATGTGIAAAAPVASLSPTTLSFPNTTIGSSSTAMSTTLSNTGNATLNISGITLSDTTDFSETTTCGSTLAAGKTCAISVTFKPAAAQAYTATLSVADDATGSPQTVTLSGSGAGGVTASPTTIDFGNQEEYTENYAGVKKITITNNSTATLSFGTLTFSSGFVLYQDDCGAQLLGNSSCYYLVAFFPQSVGAFSGTVSIPFTGSTSTPNPLVVNLTGTGTAGTPVIDLYPLPVDFGQLPIGTPATAITLQVEETGYAPLTGISVSISGANAADYTETNTCSGVTINPYPGTGSCSVTVNFTPSGIGPRAASLTVTSNSGAATFSTPLQGAGVAQLPQVQFTPTQLNLFAGAGGACTDATAGGAATTATLCNITGTTQDYLGNTYLVDNTYNVIYKVDTTGAISIFAGTPSKTGGYSGDNGPATSATLSGPTAVAADAFGDIFISDTGNSAIREVDTTGMITTLVDGTCNAGGRGTPMHRNAATNARQAHPHYLQLCETFQPEGLIVDSSGNLIFADALNNVVLETNITTGAFNFVAGDAEGTQGTAGYNGDNIPADGAKLNAPQDVAVDPAGNVYIADTLNYRVRKVTTATGIITTVAGNGTQGDTGDGATATSAEIIPYGVSADLAGDLFITTGAGGLVRKVDITGNINVLAGNGTGAIGGPASTGAVTNAYFARLDNSGDLIIPAGPQVLAAGPDGLLQFGSEAMGTTSTALNVTVENTGDSNLTLGSTVATVGGANAGDFALGTSTCTTSLAPGKTCAVAVTFDPTATGARTASLSFATNAAGSPQTVLLQGNGTTASAPAASLSPTTLSFPNTAVGSTATAMSTTLSNTGNATLNISGITLAGTNTADFTIGTSSTACGSTLAAGSTCTISVTFTPAAVASYTASISVADNATGSPQTATLSGTGTASPAPIASLSPTTLAFPATTAGSTATAMSTTLSNTGNAVLNITGITLTGANTADFAITTSDAACGSTLAAGSTCTISATFTPSVAGSFSASISVADNAAGSPQTATLTGTGNAPPATDFGLTVTPPAQTVSPGGVAQFTVNTTGIGGDFENAIQLTATGLPGGFTATFAPASVTPGANGASSVLSIQTTSQTALALPHRGPHPWLPVPLAALLVVPLLGLRKCLGKLRLVSCLLLAGALAPVLMLTGCSGGYYSLVTKTYTVTVTGTSGSTQHSTTVTLTVQQ